MRDVDWWSFKNVFGCLCTWVRPLKCRVFCFGTRLPSGGLDFPGTVYGWAVRRTLCGPTLLWSPLPLKSASDSHGLASWSWPLKHLYWPQEINTSQQYGGNTITASTALPRALNSHPRLKKKKKKKIAIGLISAKWHTKRKLTIGCYLHSQSDSHFPAFLSPCGCQADCSLPISFRPQQPKKAPPRRATTSRLFWY